MIFGWKKKESTGAAANAFVPQPAKAKEWVTRAKTFAAQGNHETALTYLAMGVRLDPGELTTHETMWECGIAQHKKGGKPATSADLKNLDGNGMYDAFAKAEYAWMRDMNTLERAFSALEEAAEVGLTSWGTWIAPRALNLVRAHMAKKASKKVWVRAKDVLSALDAHNEALFCGQEAVRLDPSDGDLQAEINQLSAARAIQAGGYAENAQREGGFRANVKDLDKQRALEEQDSIAGAAGSEERNLVRAKSDYETAPTPDAVSRYGTLLRRKQSGEGEDLAHAVYMDGFQKFGEYRFRMAAGDILMAKSRRAMEAALAASGAAPQDGGLQAAAEKARAAHAALELAEFTERSERYPTDRAIRFELGRLLLAMGKAEDAMAHFQSAKDEARLHVTAAHMLGRCFVAEGWHAEAIDEFRDALRSLDASQPEREQDIKYDLMCSLIAVARAEKDTEKAREAAEICSAILRKDIGYRDIRARRKELDALVKELA